jgi:mono/diheme cytochrome c family protein
VAAAAARGGPPVTASTVWDGVFTVGQAERGATTFAQYCAGCHGQALTGGEGPALAGDRFWDRWGQRALGDMLTYISTNMPYELGALPAPQYLDLTAYLLRENGMPAGEVGLTAEIAAGVGIVPEDGDSELPNSTLAYVVGCLAPSEAGEWHLMQGSVAERAEGLAGNPDRALGSRSYPLLFVLSPLDEWVGHRLAVTGLLVGDGGANGINVNTIESLAPDCT